MEKDAEQLDEKLKSVNTFTDSHSPLPSDVHLVQNSEALTTVPNPNRAVVITGKIEEITNFCRESSIPSEKAKDAYFYFGGKNDAILSEDGYEKLVRLQVFLIPSHRINQYFYINLNFSRSIFDRGKEFKLIIRNSYFAM